MKAVNSEIVLMVLRHSFGNIPDSALHRLASKIINRPLNPGRGMADSRGAFKHIASKSQSY